MSHPAPRPRDVIVDQLRHLHGMRSRAHAEVLTWLASLDGIDRRISALLDELTTAARD